MTQEALPNILVANRYQLTKLLGRGGMGSVWEGVHNSLGTRVAVKFIDGELAKSAEARNRFHNEARAAASIQSRYVVQILDHGLMDDGRPYIVMEYLDGESLDARILRSGSISPRDTARILGQVARGLSKAHELGIVHRDLKPENIFLTRSADGDEEVAKIVDFGIAKLTAAAPGVASSTRTGAVMGTPYYMSPEQVRGLKTVDHRTDVWALGVVAFQCLTGQHVFNGESTGDLLVKICTSPLPVASTIRPGLPPAFDAWLARSLERELENRFQSCAEQAAALASVCGLSQSEFAPQSAQMAFPAPAVTNGQSTSSAYEVPQKSRKNSTLGVLLAVGAFSFVFLAAAAILLFKLRAADSKGLVAASQTDASAQPALTQPLEPTEVAIPTPSAVPPAQSGAAAPSAIIPSSPKSKENKKAPPADKAGKGATKGPNKVDLGY